MSSLFVSHSSKDKTQAIRIADRLHAEKLESFFLDFDPQQGIPAGRNWEQELYSELRKADAVLFLASPASLSSRWCFAELTLARSISKPVFPIVIAQKDPDSDEDDQRPLMQLLHDVQWIDLVEEGDPAFARLWISLKRHGLDPRDSFAWDQTRSPYPGLEPFTQEDAAVFFGRSEKIERLLGLLQPTLQAGGSKFVAVVGPSGSGKSSLVRAGLLPRLGQLPDRWVVISPLMPGERPMRNLARSLTISFRDRDIKRETEYFEARLAAGPPALIRLAEDLCDSSPGIPSQVLLVIDQAEELLTQSDPTQRESFLDLLRGALHGDSPLWVVATLRAEFLSASLQQIAIAEIIDESLLVEPLPRPRLAEVIEAPAGRAGLSFEAGLVGRMVDETEGGDALPLLAYTLRQLYRRVGPDGRITSRDYEEVGGVLGALRSQADAIMEELRRAGTADLVLPTLLKLVTVDAEGEPTRRRIRRALLDEAENEIAEAFVKARLLKSYSLDNDPVLEVTHEALLRAWSPLSQAVKEQRNDLSVRSELERLAQDWDHTGRRRSYLLVGDRLEQARRWVASHPDTLAEQPLVRSFVERSIRDDPTTMGRAYLSDLARTDYPQIQAALLQTDQDLRAGELSQANIGQVMTMMNARARQRLGSGYASYIRLKLQSIAGDLADIVARAYAYPAASGQASEEADEFVRTVMLATIADRFPAGRAEVTEEALVRFLRTFDLAFTDRRLRFVIEGLNDAYREDDPRFGPLDPDRRQLLDMVKAELYVKIEELWDVVSPDAIQAGVGREPFGLFDEDQLAEPVRRELSPQQFAHDHRAQLDALLDRLGAYLDGALESFPGRVWERFVAVTGGWPELQQLLLVRFLGFPMWDIFRLPILALTELGADRREFPTPTRAQTT